MYGNRSLDIAKSRYKLNLSSNGARDYTYIGSKTDRNRGGRLIISVPPAVPMNIDPMFQSARVSVRSIAICPPWADGKATEAVEATEAIEATEATHMLTVANHPYTPALNGDYVSVGSLYRDDSPPRNFKASADHHLFRMDTETNTYLLFSYGIHDTATWYIGVYPVLATDVDYLNNNSTTLGQTAQHSIGIGWNDFPTEVGTTGSFGHYPTEAYSPSHTLTGVYTPGTPAVAGTPGSVAVAAQPFTPFLWSSPMCMIRLIGASQPNNQEQLFASQNNPRRAVCLVATH
jgi:hypothetical protein